MSPATTRQRKGVCLQHRSFENCPLAQKLVIALFAREHLAEHRVLLIEAGGIRVARAHFMFVEPDPCGLDLGLRVMDRVARRSTRCAASAERTGRPGGRPLQIDALSVSRVKETGQLSSHVSMDCMHGAVTW